MLLRSNLRLLLAQLDSLAETPYFSSELETYIGQLRDVLAELQSRVQSSPPSINIDVARLIAVQVWQLTQFLTGSTAKQIPYEVVYAIEKSAKEWGGDRLLITTAIIQEANFYFHGGGQIFEMIQKELGIQIGSRPVQVALPFVYRHKPLFCVPLFHELGHFIDADNEIVTTSLLNSPADSGPDLPDLKRSLDIAACNSSEKKYWEKITCNHRMEYFADLVSVAYVGQAALGFIKEFTPSAAVTESHPSTTARIKLMTDFLDSTTNPIIDLFQHALSCRGLPQLKKRYHQVSVDESFGNVRPCTLKTPEEVFGIFEAGWIFLDNMVKNPKGLWANLPEADIERITNDLVEKSLRNNMITEGWHAALNA